MVQETSIRKRETPAVQPEQMRSGLTYTPAVDIVERETELLLLADMPGVKLEDLNVNYEHGELTIHGRVAPRRSGEQTNFLLHEYGVGDFHRRFKLGDGLDAARIEANLHAGVLTLHLPKAKEMLPRKIKVQMA